MAYVVYAVIGVFAAARYGLSTEGDVLVSPWLPGRWDGVLSASMTFYLSVRRGGCSGRGVPGVTTSCGAATSPLRPGGMRGLH